ncbi:MAG: hypothetical protein ACPGKS_09655 [Coraliomargarita sp.]
MELLTPAFAILLIKVVISVMPGVVGVYFIGASEESKRSLRSWVCNKLFGVSNAFEYRKFARFLTTVGIICFLFSLLVSWFLLLSPLFSK